MAESNIPETPLAPQQAGELSALATSVQPTEDQNVGQLHVPQTGEPDHDIFRNLIPDFTEQELTTIGSDVVRGYTLDKQSRSEWETKHAQWTEMFLLNTQPKTFPWEGSSAIILPVLSTATIQFQARAYEAILPSKDVVHAKAINTSSISDQIARRVEKYMNYQFQYKMDNFQEGMDRSLMALAIDGTVIRKVYYDPIDKCPRVDYVSADDFVINYYAKDLKSAQRYTHRIELSINDIAQRVDAGIFLNAEQLLTSSSLEVSAVQTQANLSQGLTVPAPNGSDEAQPRELLEQHCYLKLPNSTTKAKHPVIVTVDKETQKVVRIISRNNPITKKTLQSFVQYQFLPNPYSFYGIGFGLLLTPVNVQMNTTVNQLNDAGLLCNTKCGFTLKKAGGKGGKLKMGMGEFPVADFNVDDIRKAIQVLDFGQPSTVLFQLLGFMKEFFQELTTVSELTTGGMPSSDTPATTVMSLMEEGRKVFSNIHRRTFRSFSTEQQIIFQLNAIHADLDEYFTVVVNPDLLIDDKGNPIPPELVKGQIANDFTHNIDVKPVADPNIVSRVERMSKAQAIYQTVMSNPLLAQDQQKVILAFKKYMTEMEQPEQLVEQLCQIPAPKESRNITNLGNFLSGFSRIVKGQPVYILGQFSKIIFEFDFLAVRTVSVSIKFPGTPI